MSAILIHLEPGVGQAGCLVEVISVLTRVLEGGWGTERIVRPKSPRLTCVTSEPVLSATTFPPRVWPAGRKELRNELLTEEVRVTVCRDAGATPVVSREGWRTRA